MGLRNDLNTNLKLKWKIIKKYIKNKLSIIDNINNWCILKNLLKNIILKWVKSI